MANLTSRRKRPLDRRSGELRDARLIIVATEGSETEKIYFNSFRFTNIQVKVIPSQEGRSAPQHILQNALAFQRDYELGAGDELWIAIDVDRWKKRALSEVASMSRAAGIKLAVSNPCFELWLALHLDAELPNPVDASNLESHMRHHLGSFNKNNYDPLVLIPNVDKAIERAVPLEGNPRDRWPQNLGTHCFKLARSIRRGRQRPSGA